MANIHERMPVILEPEDFQTWLAPETRRLGRLQDLLQPAASGVLELFQVSSYVNKAGNEGKQCIEAVSSPAG